MQKSRKIGFLAVVLAFSMVLSPMAFAKTTSEIKAAKVQKSYSMTLATVAAPFALGYTASEGSFENAWNLIGHETMFTAADNYTAGGVKLFQGWDATQITARFGHTCPVICFTAPANGTYTFSPTFHTWEDNNAYIFAYCPEKSAFGTDSNQAGGMAKGVNRTITTTGLTMSKGDHFYIYIRCGYGTADTQSQLSLDSYSVTADVDGDTYANTVTYDLSDYGTTLDFGAISIGYGAGASGAYSYSHNFVPFTGYSDDGNRTALSGVEGDTYAHFWKPGNDLCFRIQPGAGDGIHFVAPADGVYSYHIKAHLWDNESRQGEIGINIIPKAGEETWFDGLYLQKTPTSIDKTEIKLKKGDVINFVIRSINGLTEPATLDEFVVTGTFDLPTQDELILSNTANGGFYTAAADGTYEDAVSGSLSFTVKFDPAVIAQCGSTVTKIGVYVYESGVDGRKPYTVEVPLSELTKDNNEGYYRVVITDITPAQFGKIAAAAPFVVYGDKVVSGESTTVTAMVADYSTNWLGVPAN